MSRKSSSSGASEERKKYNVDPARFVEVWERSPTAEDAARELGMPRDIVHARASSYRSKGVDLKNMPHPGKKPLNIDDLNKVIARVRKETGKKGK